MLQIYHFVLFIWDKLLYHIYQAGLNLVMWLTMTLTFRVLRLQACTIRSRCCVALKTELSFVHGR